MKYRGMIRPEIERITENANFTDDEMEIFTLLTREKSLIEISTRTNLSVSTVKRRIAKIDVKVARINGTNNNQ
jgi:DNA-binding NarL/FixJ family response regulator